MHTHSIVVGKSILLGLKILGRRGSALPGYAIEKIDKNFLRDMLAQLPDGVVVISGTNGKTTTTKMVAKILSDSGKRVLTNPTGSNFTRGVVASIVKPVSLAGKLPFDIAVIELDEAYAAKFVQQIKPRASLILNVMRDQMDRFGEIDYTAQLLSAVVKKTTEVVVLNRDDTRVSKLYKDASASVNYYGVAPSLKDIFRDDDELHGGSSASSKQPATVQLDAIDDDKITTTIDGHKQTFALALYGLYNAQNAVAAMALCHALAVPRGEIIKSIATVKPAFGRGERIMVGKKQVILQLVKNPSGFRQSLLGASKINDVVTLIAINDAYADGRDVSWLWDVSFEVLQNKTIITSGVRAADMALRLQYEDIKVKQITPNLYAALDDALNIAKNGDTVHIYTTYTAMLDLRKYLSTLTEVEKV